MEDMSQETYASQPLQRTHSLHAVRNFLDPASPVQSQVDEVVEDNSNDDDDEEEEDLSLELQSGENWMCLSTSAHLLASQSPYSSHPRAPHASMLNVASLLNAPPDLNPEASSSLPLKGPFLMIDIDGDYCTMKDIRLRPPEPENEEDGDDDDDDDEANGNSHYRFSICRKATCSLVMSSWDHISFTRRLIHFYEGDRLILWETSDLSPTAVPSAPQICLVWQHKLETVLETDDDGQMVSQLEFDETQQTMMEEDRTSSEQQVLTQAESSIRQPLTQPEESDVEKNTDPVEDEDDDETVDPRDAKAGATKPQPQTRKTPKAEQNGDLTETQQSLQNNLKECVAIASAMKEKTEHVETEDDVQPSLESSKTKQTELVETEDDVHPHVETPRTKPSRGSQQQDDLRSPDLLSDSPTECADTNPTKKNLNATQFSKETECVAGKDTAEPAPLVDEDTVSTDGEKPEPSRPASEMPKGGKDASPQKLTHKECYQIDSQETLTEPESGGLFEHNSKDNAREDSNSQSGSQATVAKVQKGLVSLKDENGDLQIAEAKAKSPGEKDTVLCDILPPKEQARDDNVEDSDDTTLEKALEKDVSLQKAENEDTKEVSLVEGGDVERRVAGHATQDAALMLANMARETTECAQAPGEQAHESNDLNVCEEPVVDIGRSIALALGTKTRADGASPAVDSEDAGEETVLGVGDSEKNTVQDSPTEKGSNRIAPDKDHGPEDSAKPKLVARSDSPTKQDDEGDASARDDERLDDNPISSSAVDVLQSAKSAGSISASDPQPRPSAEDSQPLPSGEKASSKQTRSSEHPAEQVAEKDSGAPCPSKPSQPKRTRQKKRGADEAAESIEGGSGALGQSKAVQGKRTRQKNGEEDTAADSTGDHAAGKAESGTNGTSACTGRTRRSAQSMRTEGTLTEIQSRQSKDVTQKDETDEAVSVGVVATPRKRRASQKEHAVEEKASKRKKKPEEEKPSRTRRSSTTTTTTRAKATGRATKSAPSTRKRDTSGTVTEEASQVHLLVTGGNILTREEKTVRVHVRR